MIDGRIVVDASVVVKWYVTVAEKCRFVTADEALVQSLRHTPLAQFIQSL